MYIHIWEGGIMVSVLNYRASSPGSSPGRADMSRNAG